MGTGSNLVTVSSQSHHQKLASGLWNFFTTKHKVDIYLQWGERSILGHQLVLDVFLSTDKLSRSVLVDRDSNLDLLLEFVYNGQVTVQQEQLPSLLEVARELDFELLVDAVEAVSPMKNNRRGNLHGIIRKRGTGKRKSVVTREVKSSRDNRTSRGSKISRERKNADTPLSKKHKLESENVNQRPQSEEIHEDLSTEEDDSNCDDPSDATFRPGSRITRSSTSVTRSTSSSGRSLLSCRHCHYETRNRTRFDLHQATQHDSSRPVFVCELCSSGHGRRFLSQANLERHKRLSHEKPLRTFTCVDCSYRTCAELRYLAHRATHDSSKLPSSELLEARQNSNYAVTAGLHCCPHCDYSNRDKTIFQIHMRKHDASIEIHRCDLCSNTFLSRTSLDSHKARHTIYRCKFQFCKFQTRKKRAHYQHLYSRHKINARGEPLERKFSCPDCNCRSFVLQCELRYHRMAKHSNERPHKCRLCLYSSSRKADVSKHVKVVHLKIRPFVCNVCGHRCASKCHLDEHKLKHTNERPYKCPTCKNSYFKSPVALKKHIRQHNNEDKQFVCSTCSAVFCQLYSLKVHEKNVHRSLIGQAETPVEPNKVVAGEEDPPTVMDILPVS